MKSVHILSALMLMGFVTQAQDPHFSQYFSSPMTLNPANTGNFEGPSRLSGNFRNQWQGIGEPYVTGTASFDTEFLKKKSGSGNRFALGFTGLFDRTSGGMLTSNYLSASVGYHIKLDREEINKLSIGFQTTMANRRLDYTKISFASQFGSYGFDLTAPSNQTFQTGNISYLDWSTGVLFTQTTEEKSFYAGISAYHLTRPNESFLGNQSNRIPMRMTVHGGGTVNVGVSGTIMASGLMNFQGHATESVFGIAYGHQIESKYSTINVFIGSWYRLDDAIIPYVGYTYDNFQLGISYDVTTSGLNTASTKNRSFELSFIYKFLDKSEYRRFVPWY